MSTKKRTCRIVNFAVLVNHRLKLKESKKRDKYLELTGELKKKTMNKKMTVIPIIIGALGNDNKK